MEWKTTGLNVRPPVSNQNPAATKNPFEPLRQATQLSQARQETLIY